MLHAVSRGSMRTSGSTHSLPLRALVLDVVSCSVVQCVNLLVCRDDKRQSAMAGGPQADEPQLHHARQ
jgi:hypothetical protein